MTRYILPLMVAFGMIAFMRPAEASALDVDLAPGFTLSKVADVPDARSLVPVPELGVIFVGSRGERIHMIVDADLDGSAESVKEIAAGLNVPNGIAWQDGYLYVAEQHQLVRYWVGDQIPDRLENPELLYDKFPNKRWHGWRYAAFGPDRALYVSIGVACNICETQGLEGTIVRMAADSSWIPEIYAQGIRNSVGITFDPTTGHMLFTDNGADNMGDDVPPDELNRATAAGRDFGFPYYGGGDIRTPDFKALVVGATEAPEHEFRAHVAPLGLHIYSEDRFPERYKGGAFVALHGSWNRTTPVGYKIVHVPLGDQISLEPQEDIVSGWLQEDESITARPVDIKPWTGGRLLISDDAGDAVYLLDYRP